MKTQVYLLSRLPRRPQPARTSRVTLLFQLQGYSYEKDLRYDYCRKPLLYVFKWHSHSYILLIQNLQFLQHNMYEVCFYVLVHILCETSNNVFVIKMSSFLSLRSKSGWSDSRGRVWRGVVMVMAAQLKADTLSLRADWQISTKLGLSRHTELEGMLAFSEITQVSWRELAEQSAAVFYFIQSSVSSSWFRGMWPTLSVADNFFLLLNLNLNWYISIR